ncbi:MAG: 4-(cytidine 5'-diphospho)-2-C-methyl-D-erythritol kinase [Cytophagaceae bacterium]|nr:4-(cytidine 5'-diphospho)-2-C-methyl-D-erythritol kinase [Cytophagaceae bacterium]MBK9511670.1 4-(cytidine 5'-diphospho)-2-C-methyl-D-erythritol kinase [Cytophagaceae bacterium]MBK9935072.1 4-(cytidine 5'-diphospho)-2-C-methyl-D-erythritol kinase [Cytophagaceae bacterium]MBL0301515.1 4-(cytidine 5'-diphospho)-2-C-methyl-D-erythritol kinase [Cytophagaceae bacterium]MBL0324335.1 4-(cytidine 5'-diphospho)-2-C-methyl-D-erythritol kinase [Cytophagaceae bacterium]
MLTFPNAKINLGLNVIGKRPDGYHNIESVFYPVEWTDALEIIKADEFSFKSSGLEIPGETANNLIIKAYKILVGAGLVFENSVNIHLHKVIPMGAGIGGGSADGAFALKMLNEIFELNLSDLQLEDFASQLGSDCPFFIQNRPKFCFGRGTDFEEIDFSLKGYSLVLANPQIHISTAEAYSGVIPHIPEISIKEILKMPVSQWKELLVNDFEEKIQLNHPKISEVKQELYSVGALYASMTGSGSTVYGIFENLPEKFSPENCVIWTGKAKF